MEAKTAPNSKVIHYSVNGEPQETVDHKLTVTQILTNAGFTPPGDYELTRDAGNQVFNDVNEEVPIHEGEKFTATFRGPTPTS
jgi:hypothetical protein